MRVSFGFYLSSFIAMSNLFLPTNLYAKLYHTASSNNEVRITRLINAIISANTTIDDDIIDLGGMIYTLTRQWVQDPNFGCTALPPIVNAATAGKLSIINGAIEAVPNNTANCPNSSYRFLLLNEDADLSLFNMSFYFGNSSGFGSDLPNSGGAIANVGGILSIKNTLFFGNNAVNGGALYNSGIVRSIEGSILSGNSATFGGALLNAADGEMVINATSIINNDIGGGGGGIFNAGFCSVVNSTIANNGNEEDIGGGGVLNIGLFSLVNSTISGNGFGNGIEGAGIYNESEMAIFNSTISNNGSGGAGTEGGGIYNVGSINSLVSTIVAGNFAVVGADISNLLTINTENNNLIGVAVGTTIVNNVNYDLVIGTNTALLGLGPLQDNGGITFTQALLPQSIAINRGFVDADVDITTDQRRGTFERLSCALPDIGAYELQVCSLSP